MTDPLGFNWRHLRAVCAVVARGSMSGAAEAVGISQPALTQGLAKLEQQLGVALFERRHDGVAPTADGRLMGERVAAALEHLAQACRRIARGGGRGFSRPEQLVTATQLGAFLQVAERGSFVAAAGASGLSQPSLHRAVRDLEQVIAVPLVERRGRGIALTEAGRRLARGVRLARAEIAAALAEIGGPSGQGGRLVIGALPLCRAWLLPTTIAALAQERRDLAIDVVEGSWRELAEPLRDGVIDLMIGAMREAATEGLEQRPLFVDRLAIIGRAGHPLAGDAPLDWAGLARFPWIVNRPGTPLRQQWEALFAGIAERPPAPIECGSVMVARGVLRDSDFLTLLSPDQVALELDCGALARIGPPLPGARRTIGVTTRAGWRPTSGQQRFLELLSRQAAARTVQENE